MSIRSERIKAIVENSDLSYQELEKMTGIKKSSLQRYASGATTKIPLDVIEKLSVAFNVSQEYLMGWDEKKDSPSEPELTEGERMLLNLFRQIPEDQQRVFLDMGRVYANSLKKD
jgi:transcriptional regulator with XRE-family HTH domain